MSYNNFSIETLQIILYSVCPMKVTRTSQVSGITHTLDLDITEAQLRSYNSGRKLLQEAFPHLDSDSREFIKSGITPEEWAKIFG